jgi:tetratricopeptide (TPR) repeat protein
VLAEDPFALDDAIAALRRFGLIKADEQALTVHRLLQHIIREQLAEGPRAARVAVVVRLLDQALPFGGYRDPGLWPMCAWLLPHALAATEHAVSVDVEPMATAHVLENAADYLHGRARYAEARSLSAHALAIREAHLGAGHADTAHSLNNLASVLHDEGDLDAARDLYERALAIREGHLGPDHFRTGWSLYSLADVLRAQGDPPGARALLERTLEIWKARLGPDHPDTARGRYRLASVLRAQGDLPGARALLERALPVWEVRFGHDHPDTARARMDLALQTALEHRGRCQTTLRIENKWTFRNGGVTAVGHRARDDPQPVGATW